MDSDLLTRTSLHVLAQYGREKEQKRKVTIPVPSVDKHSSAVPYPIYKIVSCDTTFLLFPE
jgi:hypothetical protein